MSELVLSQILAGCRAGEEEACRELVSRFQESAHGLARALLGDAHLAEDAVQCSFVRALESLGDLRDERAFAGWFRQIVRTECHRIGRRRRNECGVFDQDAVSVEKTAVDVMEAAEREQLVREALAALPEIGRETAALFYLDERPCVEVARILDVPEGTVKRRLHDARKRLREMLLGLNDAEG